jgi:hypothetical protein
MAKSRMNRRSNRRMNRRTKRRQSGGKKVGKTSKKNRTIKQSKQSSLRMKQIKQLVKKIDTKFKKAKRSKRTKRVSSRQDRGGLDKGQKNLLKKFLKDRELTEDLQNLMKQINRLAIIGPEEFELRNQVDNLLKEIEEEKEKAELRERLALEQKKIMDDTQKKEEILRKAARTRIVPSSPMGPTIMSNQRQKAIAKMKKASESLASKQEKIDAAARERAEKRRADNRKKQKAERAAQKMQEQIEAIRQANAPYCQHCNDEAGINCGACRQYQ